MLWTVVISGYYCYLNDDLEIFPHIFLFKFYFLFFYNKDYEVLNRRKNLSYNLIVHYIEVIVYTVTVSQPILNKKNHISEVPLPGMDEWFAEQLLYFHFIGI